MDASGHNTPKQRKQPRAVLHVSIDMTFINAQSKGALDGQEHYRIHRADIRDLSSTGMMLRTCDFNPQLEKALLKGEVAVSLAFSLPSYPNKIKAIVQVIRIKKESSGVAVFYNIGTRFLQVSPPDQAAIDRYVRGRGKKDI